MEAKWLDLEKEETFSTVLP